MRFGSFLLGGIVGAAAVVYLSNRSKPMLWSVLSKSGTLGSMMNPSNNEKSESAKTKMNDLPAFAKSALQSTQSNQAGASAGAKKNNASEKAFASGSLSGVSEIVNRDPKLKSQVEEILASNNQKEELEVQ